MTALRAAGDRKARRARSPAALRAESGPHWLLSSEWQGRPVRFWDSFAIVPLLVKEAASATTHQLLTEDRDMTVWWASEVGYLSALMKLEPQSRSLRLHPLQATGSLRQGFTRVIPAGRL